MLFQCSGSILQHLLSGSSQFPLQFIITWDIGEWLYLGLRAKFFGDSLLIFAISQSLAIRSKGFDSLQRVDSSEV